MNITEQLGTKNKASHPTGQPLVNSCLAPEETSLHPSLIVLLLPGAEMTLDHKKGEPIAVFSIPVSEEIEFQ